MARSRLVRCPPCPAYDVAGTESWLSDMAREGWLLEKDGFFCGLAFFEKGEPREMTYRLSAAPKGTSMWADNYGEPDREEKDLSAQLGWEYVAKRGEFHLYRHEGEVERELHTDPQVQALAVKQVLRRQWSSAVLAVFWMLVYPALRLRGSLLLAAVTIGPALSLLCLLMVGIGVGSCAWRVFYYGRMKGRLERGEVPEHEKDWRGPKKRYDFRSAAWLCLVVLTGVLVLRGIPEEMPMAEFEGTVPFATLREIAGGEIVKYELYLPQYCTVRAWGNAIGPVNVTWHEHADLSRADGSHFSAGLTVNYHELANGWLARGLAEEYLRRDKWEYGRGRRGFQELDLPDLGLDEARAYTGFAPTVVLRQGNQVIHACFWQSGPEGEQLGPAEWAAVLAESLQ